LSAQARSTCSAVIPSRPRFNAAITDQIAVDQIKHLWHAIKDLREDLEFLADIVAGRDGK